MKKYFIWGGLAICAVLALGNVIMACSSDSDIISEEKLSDGLKDLEGYFATDDYVAFLTYNNFTDQNLAKRNVTKESFSEKGLDIYTIPVEKEELIVGKLYVFAYRNKYKTIYEDWSNATEQVKSGTVKVSTGDGKFIASLKIERKEGKLLSQIDEVAEIETTRANGESWWGCTKRVYSMAKKACGSDSSCDLLCDLVNVAAGNQCTVSVAAAAAIACAIYG